MLDKLAKEPYVAPGRFLQFGIWIPELSFNRENVKPKKIRNSIVSVQPQESKLQRMN